jgi:hypothetical protein
MDNETPMKKVLFLAANPKGTPHLRLDQELRDIAEALERCKKRDQFTLEQRLAVRPRDIQRAMLNFEPNIVHFSGHGAGEEGLVFEDETGKSKLVSGDALAGLFKLFANQIECVVLNGCYSEVQAKAIAQHINYVIGMSKAIDYRAAIEFAVGFYNALGAGESIEFAYQFGCAAIQMAGIEEHLTPVLFKKAAVAADMEPPTTPIVETPFIKSQSISQPENQANKQTSSENFTNPQRLRLEKQRETFQRDWDLRNEKLGELRQAEGIEAGANVKFQLKKQIEAEEKELNKLSKQLSEIEQNLEKLQTSSQNILIIPKEELSQKK